MRHLLAAVLCFSLSVPALVPAQPPKTDVKLKLDEAAWQVAPYQGGKFDITAIDADGRPATAVGPNGLVLTTTKPVEPDTELVVRFRITMPKDKGQGSGLTLAAGQKKAG